MIDLKKFFSSPVYVEGIKLYNAAFLTIGIFEIEFLLSNFCSVCTFESGASGGKERQSVVYRKKKNIIVQNL